MRNEAEAASKAASLMGKRSYKARLERFGLEIAHENGKKGGRPKGHGKGQANKRRAKRASRTAIATYAR